MALKDYYQVLGVESAASAEEIKRAYRRLARELHPDATGGDKDKEDRFREITAAYDFLADAVRRDLYDATRRIPRRSEASPPSAASKSPEPRPRFPGGQQGFDIRGGRPAPAPAPSHAGPRAPTMAARPVTPPSPRGGASPGLGRGLVDLTLAEAVLGAEKSLTLELPNGAERDVRLPIAPGTEDGDLLRVPGARPGLLGGGDILLHVRVLPDARFRREGSHLEVALPLRVDQAVLGGEVEVPTLTGSARLTVPEGTGSGQRFVVPGQGGSDRQGRRGDLHAVVQIAMPERLNDEARAHMRRFAAALDSAQPLPVEQLDDAGAGEGG